MANMPKSTKNGLAGSHNSYRCSCTSESRWYSFFFGGGIVLFLSNTYKNKSDICKQAVRYCILLVIGIKPWEQTRRGQGHEKDIVGWSGHFHRFRFN